MLPTHNLTSPTIQADYALLPLVTDIKISEIEKSNLNVGEKINLLLILINKKWTCEIGVKQKLSHDQLIKKYKDLLDKLELKYAKNLYEHSKNILDYVYLSKKILCSTMITRMDEINYGHEQTKI